MNRLRITTTILLLGALIMLSSFVTSAFEGDHPAPIMRSTNINNIGEQVVQTEILIDKSTTREDLIHACKFLAEEDVELTFESLDIRKGFLGLLGKSRIAYAKGKIELPNGSIEEFEAGGLISFRSIKVTYSKNMETSNYYINRDYHDSTTTAQRG